MIKSDETASGIPKGLLTLWQGARGGQRPPEKTVKQAQRSFTEIPALLPSACPTK